MPRGKKTTPPVGRATDPATPPQATKHTKKRGRPAGWKKPVPNLGAGIVPTGIPKITSTIQEVATNALGRHSLKFSAATNVEQLQQTLLAVRGDLRYINFAAEMFTGLVKHLEDEITQIEHAGRSYPAGQQHRSAGA
jgi:hypothetical protein